MRRALVGLAALAAFCLVSADFNGPAPIAWRWADSIRTRPTGTPIIKGDRIYAAVGSRMYCLERATGNQIWRYPAGEPLQANFATGASVYGNLLIAAADDRSVYAVNTDTGEKAWQYVADNGIFTKPVVVGSAVVFGLASNQLIAISAQNGRPIWTEPYSPSAGIYDSLASWHNNVIFLTSDGLLTSLDVTTKRTSWRPRQFTNVSPLSDLTVAGDNIYLNSGAYLTSLTASTGMKRFDQVIPGQLRFSAAVGHEAIAVVTDSGRMYTFNLRGQAITRTGFDLNASAAAAPTFVGDLVAIPLANGALNLIDPFSGQIVWNFTVPPMVKGMKVTLGAGNTGGGGASGRGGGALGGGGGAGQPANNELEIKYVAAAGPVTAEGDTLVLLAQDGSILAFDKNLGVDLTPPEVVMAWPNAGDQVSGRAPMELVFLVSDAGSGANLDGLAVTINGNSYVHEIDKEGRVRVRILSSAGPNFPLADGRARITVGVSDWMGNATAASFVLSIDNTLPALGSPKLPDSGTTGGASGGGPRGGGGGGSLGGGG